MTEYIGVQQAASYPFGQRPISHLLSTGQALGERAFADRADRACGRVKVPAILFHRQEVSPMHAESALGSPLSATTERLR